MVDVVKYLIETGKVDVNWRDCNERSLLHLTVEGLGEIFNADSYYEIMKYIIEDTNFDIFATDNDDTTVLQVFFDIMFHECLDGGELNEKSIPLLKYLSNKYFEKNHFTADLIAQFFCIAMLHDLHDFKKSIFYYCFDWTKETPEHQLIKKFIEIFEVELNPQYYGFCVVILAEIEEETKFKLKLFERGNEWCDWFYHKLSEKNSELVTTLLKNSFDYAEKLNVFLDCLRLCKNFVSWIWMNGENHEIYCYQSSILYIDINPVTKNEKRGLLKFFNILHELEAPCLNPENIFSRYFDHSEELDRILEIFWPFGTASYNMPPEYNFHEKDDLPSLKELSRRIILDAIYTFGIPHKEFVKKVESLKLPKILIRYLRFMDELPEIE